MLTGETVSDLNDSSYKSIGFSTASLNALCNHSHHHRHYHRHRCIRRLLHLHYLPKLKRQRL